MNGAVQSEYEIPQGSLLVAAAAKPHPFVEYVQLGVQSPDIHRLPSVLSEAPDQKDITSRARYSEQGGSSEYPL